LANKLCKILEILLSDEPIVINSLSFTKGSQQPHHFDTYYMPPPVRGMMAVSSVCLEDQTEDSGPLSYYPGSHKIHPYEFSHGGIHAVNDEMEQATKFAMSEIRKRGLHEEIFIGNAGDVFIWHGQLYYGGKQILNHSQTRKTLVTHYWRRQDLEQAKVKSIGAGHYLVREHQSV
jgi:ectoine hydroxylase-related dioxygenase (phytanoyl-CoA dioxygenase family)